MDISTYFFCLDAQNKADGVWTDLLKFYDIHRASVVQ